MCGCGWEGVIASVTAPKTCRHMFLNKVRDIYYSPSKEFTFTISQLMNWSIVTKIVYLCIPNPNPRLIVNSRVIANNFQVSKVVLLHQRHACTSFSAVRDIHYSPVSKQEVRLCHILIHELEYCDQNCIS